MTKLFLLEVQLLLLPLLQLPPDWPAMYSTKEALDDSEGNETTNVDAEGDNVVAAHPFGDGEAWTEVGV